MFKILTLLAIFGVQLIFAGKFAPLDSCEHYTGPNDYTDFEPTETDNGVTSFSFHLITPRSPHIQINAEPKRTSNYYEIVFNESVCELRRRRAGQSYLVLDSATRAGLLSTYRPFGVRVETKMEGARRFLEVFLDDEETAFLKGYDSTPLTPSYYSLSSYKMVSQYFHKCTEPESSDCSEYIGLIAALQAEVKRITDVLSNILQKAGLTLSEITNILGGVVKGGNLIDAAGNIITKVGNLVGGVVNQAGKLVGGLLSGL